MMRQPLFVVLFEDSAALLGLLVAFLGIALGDWTGIPYFDGTASVLIGLILATVAAWLALETKGLLIGESAAPEIRRRVLETVQADPGIERVHELLTLHMGPESILVLVRADYRDDLGAADVERSVAALKDSIRRHVPAASRIFIQVESGDSSTP